MTNSICYADKLLCLQFKASFPVAFDHLQYGLRRKKGHWEMILILTCEPRAHYYTTLHVYTKAPIQCSVTWPALMNSVHYISMWRSANHNKYMPVSLKGSKYIHYRKVWRFLYVKLHLFAKTDYVMSTVMLCYCLAQSLHWMWPARHDITTCLFLMGFQCGQNEKL